MLRSFRELEVWQKAHTLVLEIYRVMEIFPDREKSGITSQLRRAATSVPANIAEGFERRTTKEFLQCLTISNGSLEETRYFLILSKNLRFLSPADFDRLDKQCDSVGQMLGALKRSLRARNAETFTVRGSRIAGRAAAGI